MSECDDNACGYDVEMVSSKPKEVEQHITDCDDNGMWECTKLLKQFAELSLKMIDSENERVRSAITADRNTSAQLVQEKMSLLCSLNKPEMDLKSTIMQIDKVHMEILDKFRNVYNAEDEYLRAYSAHCDEAVKAKEALGATDKYDEYTEMPYETLVEHIEKMESEILKIKESCDEMRANRIVKRKEYEEEYKSIMEEFNIFEKYDMEALETLEMLKFEAEKIPRVLKQQIKFD